MDTDGFFRAIHTTKGIARGYNLTGLSGEIHVLEYQIVELQDENLNDEITGIRLETINDNLNHYINNYLRLAKEIYGEDIDESYLAAKNNSIEISKPLFFDSMSAIKKIAKKLLPKIKAADRNKLKKDAGDEAK